MYKDKYRLLGMLYELRERLFDVSEEVGMNDELRGSSEGFDELEEKLCLVIDEVEARIDELLSRMRVEE